MRPLNMRVAILVFLVAAAAAEPPDGMRCYYGSTHAHCWFPDGGDDGGFKTSLSRKEIREPSNGAERRTYRRSHPDLYSGGTAADAFRYARERAKLDFLAMTVHNHMTTDPEYAGLLEVARAANRRDGFCAIVGQEWSTISSGNHVNVLGTKSVCRVAKGSYREFYGKWLPSHPAAAVVILNHPNRPGRGGFGRQLAKTEYGLDDYGGDPVRLAAAARPYVRLIEVVSGPSHGRLENFRRWRGRPYGYFRYLNRGFRVGPCVGTDNHYQNWGTSSPSRTGVWARGLTPALLLEAMYRRRTFATEDSSLSVWLQVGKTPMGTAVRTAARRVTASITVRDTDEPNVTYQIRVLVDRDGMGGEEAVVVHEIHKTRGGAVDVVLDLPAVSTYVLAHVVQRSDADAAWTAPVWIDR